MSHPKANTLSRSSNQSIAAAAAAASPSPRSVGGPGPPSSTRRPASSPGTPTAAGAQHNRKHHPGIGGGRLPVHHPLLLNGSGGGVVGRTLGQQWHFAQQQQQQAYFGRGFANPKRGSHSAFNGRKKQGRGGGGGGVGVRGSGDGGGSGSGLRSLLSPGTPRESLASFGQTKPFEAGIQQQPASAPASKQSHRQRALSSGSSVARANLPKPPELGFSVAAPAAAAPVADSGASPTQQQQSQHVCQLHNETLNRCLETGGIYVCKVLGTRNYIIQKVRAFGERENSATCFTGRYLMWNKLFIRKTLNPRTAFAG